MVLTLSSKKNWKVIIERIASVGALMLIFCKFIKIKKRANNDFMDESEIKRMNDDFIKAF